ncbi:MAG: hypothetical protein LQ345_006701 [Seirophora villosa]|nr:MAG: hypothetical protein LQ345_006701 [Seirophora villosa]
MDARIDLLISRTLRSSGSGGNSDESRRGGDRSNTETGMDDSNKLAAGNDSESPWHSKPDSLIKEAFSLTGCGAAESTVFRGIMSESTGAETTTSRSDSRIYVAMNSRVESRRDSGSHAAGRDMLPVSTTDEGRMKIRQKARSLRSDLQEEESFQINQSITSRYDAQRIEQELDNIAIQIAHEEINLTSKGSSASSIRSQITKRKITALQRLAPGRCQLCDNDGQETDRMIRTSETCGMQGNEQHWYHQSCLRGLFLAAIEDEEKLPPRCCGIPIPEGFGHDLLSRTEFQAYKHKSEEKNTAHRTYCPAPSCSSFVSRRVIERAIDDRVKAVKKLERRPKRYISGAFRCPKCKISICLICKQVDHGEEDCPA